jgi:hypothetical protein
MKTKKILLCLAVVIILSIIGFYISQYSEFNKIPENASSKTVSKEKSLDKKDFLNMRAIFQKRILIPLYKLLMKNTIKRDIDSDYNLLYGRLKLSPDKLEEFKRIVFDWRLANMDRAPLINTASTAEQKKEAYRQRQVNRDKYNQEFIDLIGKEKWLIYDSFKNRNPDRKILNRFMSTISPEKRINDDQVENLVDAMYDARKSVEIEMGLYDLIDFPSEKNEKTVKRRTKMRAQVYEKYAEVCGDILPRDQAEEYKDYLRKELKRIQSR